MAGVCTVGLVCPSSDGGDQWIVDDADIAAGVVGVCGSGYARVALGRGSALAGVVVVGVAAQAVGWIVAVVVDGGVFEVGRGVVAYVIGDR